MSGQTYDVRGRLEAPAMSESEGWASGLQFDEREEFFQDTSLMTIVVWNEHGTIVRTTASDARAKREAEAMCKFNKGWMWSEGDWFTIFGMADTPGSAPIMGTQPEDDCWQGAAGVVLDVLWAPSLLTTPDKCEFTWEPVRAEYEEGLAEAEARWVEARADGECDLSLLMMEVPA